MGGPDERSERRRVDPTDEWEQLALLCRWPEQLAYEEVRPLTLFGASVAQRASETGSAERTLYRKVARFEEEGMESLFDAAGAKRRPLPPIIRRMIVELKAEHPRFSLGEIGTICYVRTGRRPGKHTIERVLAEEPVPLRILRRFEPYHEISEARERRRAVVALHAEGWTVKAIAGYMGINRDTVYTILKRWIEEGEAGL
ncbi:helix-turn-helix domain-containing protein [Rubrobacter tropicus]|uniref:Helix-turn-helix domain-containing protein n=1 Tax=Rubrobacter tropicus TaxID=2653851 RepID=A0A6G8Q8M5_9ACTN|nr:helix-turn-helix domain-containing protein [Rubrobacter tropicus]QIN82826.1 helix-turn-helix domain-containing protein [Rubrobacter tropicus]